MQTSRSQVRIADDRTSVSVEALKRSLLNHLFYLRGKLPETATVHDYYVALVQTVRDRLLSPWIATNQTYIQPPHLQSPVKRLGYFSCVFASPTLDVYLANLGISDPVRQALEEFGLTLESLLQQETIYPDTAEQGQLATCHLDSLTTLEMPVIGYGIRYQWDSADSRIPGSDQPIQTKMHYSNPNPWEISRPEQAVNVPFGGRTEAYMNEQGRFCVRWIPAGVIWGIPCDTPISGYRTNTVNTLRLWSATCVESLNNSTQPNGNGASRGSQSLLIENFNKILFLNSDSVPTQQTQLQQQFFLISCSLQDILRIHTIELKQPIETLLNTYTLQLNEIHQAIAIVELMRLLLDEHHLDWDRAWQITQNIFAYTHSASSSEASMHWSIKLFGQLLPRHLEIIYEINQRFLAGIRAKYPNSEGLIERLSLIEEGKERQIRIAHLAFAGSHLVNGTALLQIKLAKQESLREFYEIFPEKFKGQANRGISHRLLASDNPQLSDLITRRIGKQWMTRFQEMNNLETLMNEPDFCQEWRSVKYSNKRSFAAFVLKQHNISIDPNSLFDIHPKPISQRRRQLLSLFYIITLYNRIKADPAIDLTPRTFIFNEKSEPACQFSMLIVQLIRAIAAIVNHDPEVRRRLHVVCLNLTDCPVQLLYAADLAEQLETADTELIGLDSLRFALNGSVTIGTLTGDNTQFCQQVGETNCFWFGLTAEEVNALKSSGYEPWYFYHNHRELQGAIDRIAMGYFSTHDPNPFKVLIDTILDRDEYLLLADYPFYVSCQDLLGQIYSDTERWTRLSILHTARMGQFSCDRIIQEYCQEIWHMNSVIVQNC